jgi:hypothetical protein
MDKETDTDMNMLMNVDMGMDMDLDIDIGMKMGNDMNTWHGHGLGHYNSRCTFVSFLKKINL